MQPLWMHDPYQTNSCCGQLRCTCIFWIGTYLFIVRDYLLVIATFVLSRCHSTTGILSVLFSNQCWLFGDCYSHLYLLSYCSALCGGVLLSCCPSLCQFLDLVFYMDYQVLESWQLGSIKETLFWVIFHEEKTQVIYDDLTGGENRLISCLASQISKNCNSLLLGGDTHEFFFLRVVLSSFQLFYILWPSPLETKSVIF